MLTNFGFGLALLLIPLMIELFAWEADLNVSILGHTLVGIVILFGIYWLIMQVIRLDEQLYLNRMIPSRTFPDATERRDRHIGQASPDRTSR